MAGKGRSTKNSNSDALRCEKESTDVQCVCCGISFAVGMTEESLELLKACDNVKFVCDECLKSPSIKDQIIKTVESGKAEICDKINSLSKEIRSEIDAIKVKLEANEGKMSGLDVPGSKLCDEISNFRNEMTRSFASVVSSEVVKNYQSEEEKGNNYHQHQQKILNFTGNLITEPSQQNNIENKTTKQQHKEQTIRYIDIIKVIILSSIRG
ncbi:hypothetical protein HELRODRAFT_164792 [Helobdella robusta]|uniref:Uncharacterized protein n=1 Tax=Helobdella robusta TaxID=6412 RepID=T1EVT4_HELRO|nr:hypothetical protein HELRODRAFT_164792 [Helobdella robusta]ESN92697.1 hypothetical protein HELRODRAFT_164792 [Helobdella robusta]